MLIYLDNSQFAWLEQAQASEREAFLAAWRAAGCELAVSLQLLQEAHKRGDKESVLTRARTIASLEPLRGIPAGSAGVMVREAADQIRGMIGAEPRDDLAEGRAGLFPPLSPATVFQTIEAHAPNLERFNTIGEVQADLQAESRVMPPIRRDSHVPPAVMEAFIRAKQRELLAGVPESLASRMLRELGDRAIEAVRATDGRLEEANRVRLGIDQLDCLPELKDEDYSKAAGFIAIAREFSQDVADLAGTDCATVVGLVNRLRPYSAPGYGLEMAVSRARMRHSPRPKASDLVDEEHIVFAPYVDLLVVDKRTNAYVAEELRRGDSRIAYDPSPKLLRARTLDDVVAALD